MGREGWAAGGCGSFSQFTLFQFLIYEYGNIVSIPVMKLRTDLQPTGGVKRNTTQLNRHNIRPALIKNTNSASTRRSAGEKSGGFGWLQVAKSTNQQTHTNTHQQRCCLLTVPKSRAAPSVLWASQTTFTVTPPLPRAAAFGTDKCVQRTVT